MEMVITASKVARERISAGPTRPSRACGGFALYWLDLHVFALTSQAWQGGLRERGEMGNTGARDDIYRGRARNKMVGDVGPGITLLVGLESSRC